MPFHDAKLEPITMESEDYSSFSYYMDENGQEHYEEYTTINGVTVTNRH